MMKPVDYNSLVFQDGDLYIGYCPDLDVSVCGDTLEQAKELLKDAVSKFLDESERAGTISEIFEEAGYRLRDGRWTPPRLVETGLGNVG